MATIDAPTNRHELEVTGGEALHRLFSATLAPVARVTSRLTSQGAVMQAFTEGGLAVSAENGVVRLRFDRPDRLNAIDVPMAQAFNKACAAIAADRSVRLVLMAGAGRAFMAGGDLGSFFGDLAQAPETARAIIDPLHAGLSILARIDAPVLASLHGAVAGAGVSLALAADLAIAADDTRFTLAYAKIGASCDGSSSWSLPRVVGLRRALEIALLADPLDAATALSYGMVNRVVPAMELSAQTETLIARLAAGPTLAYGRIRRLLRTSFERDLTGQMAAERDAFCESARTKDFAEGLAAFFGKRTAKFEGK
jgi:2-(1,2-epoxy-1,2-dihydrophenyl)acetyl-CoA isomerase